MPQNFIELEILFESPLFGSIGITILSLFALYSAAMVRRIYRRLVWMEHQQQASDYALVKVLNGKAKEYQEHRNEYISEFLKHENFLNAPPFWKIKKIAWVFLNLFKG